MRVVVVGGTGLVGGHVVRRLEALGHQAVVASPSRGVDTITGEGVADALAGADAVVDVTNAPGFTDDEVWHFFTTATRTLVAAARAAGVGHLVVLSVVGCDRLPGSGYFRAKAEQERLVAAADLPHTVVRATQFFEFAPVIADAATHGGRVVLPPARVQPVAAADVAAVVADTALGEPSGGVVEVAGPERLPLPDFVTRALDRVGDARQVVAEPRATYFGAKVGDDQLLPGTGALLGATTYDAWCG